MWPFRKRTPVHQPNAPAEPDLPVSFGYKCAWYAVASTDTDAVVNAIQLREEHRCSWTQGIEQAYDESVFVSPPVKGWVFIVGCCLFLPTEEPEPHVEPRLIQLSRTFGTALYFATYRVAGLTVWAKAVNGSLIRAHGSQDATFWNHGPLTVEEQRLGFPLFDPTSPAADSDGYCNREDFTYPNEDHVMDIAREWSVCPNDLYRLRRKLGPSLGILGSKAEFL